jgi:hypothetical protein
METVQVKMKSEFLSGTHRATELFDEALGTRHLTGRLC